MGELFDIVTKKTYHAWPVASGVEAERVGGDIDVRGVSEEVMKVFRMGKVTLNW